MRILVVSDTHGNYQLLCKLLNTVEPFDLFLHAGDSGNDLLQLERNFPSLPRHAVAGNCDPLSSLPRELLLEAGRKRILLTHGDRYGVKHDLLRLTLKGKASRADLIVFGHTHRPLIEHSQGIILFNPGSLGTYHSKRKYSYGWVEIGPDEIKPEIRLIG